MPSRYQINQYIKRAENKVYEVCLGENNYSEVLSCLSSSYAEINGYDFYRYIFPDNENQGDLHTDYSRPNAIFQYTDTNLEKNNLRRRIMFNDNWEQDYKDYIKGNSFALCSGLSYFRRTNRITNAQKMHALIIDLDGVGGNELESLFSRIELPTGSLFSIPKPTFLVLSGTGIHIYYVLDKPIDLYPNIKIQLKSLKHRLTFLSWDYKGTSQYREVQYQSINQSFRMVGSINNKYNLTIKAFKTGDKVSLDYLNEYLDEKDKVDLKKPFKSSTMTRLEAKEKYPEWYQRVVVNKDKQRKKWDIKGKQGYALYNWWLKQSEKIVGGHRYFYMMCLAIYAYKCDVPKKKLKEDMLFVFEYLSKIKHTNPLTKDDIKSAMEAYDREYFNFTIKDIEKLTNVRIDRNRRNYRSQKDHLKYMRGIKKLKKQMGEIVKDGRPKGSGSKEKIVIDYLKENPTVTNKAKIARELGINRSTVYKYLKNK